MRDMLAVVMPSSICREGTRENSTTDTTMVTTIAIEVAYTYKNEPLVIAPPFSFTFKPGSSELECR